MCVGLSNMSSAHGPWYAPACVVGLPWVVANIGGGLHRFRSLIDLFREMAARAGHAPEPLKVGIYAIVFLGDTTPRRQTISIRATRSFFKEIGKACDGLLSPALGLTRLEVDLSALDR